MTLRRVVVLLLLVCIAHPLGADEVIFRGNYWRDRNTRVLAPEAEFDKELPSGTIVGGHYLLDTITSASVAAGVVSDQPFTELRNEVGATLGQRLGPALITGGYTYSSESDYWANTITLSGLLDLFQHDTTIGVSLAYGIDSVAQRMGPTLYNPIGGLQSFHAIATLTQVLTPTLLAQLSYDFGLLGFGSAKGKLTGAPDQETGFQGNPYRSVNLGGSPAREKVPFQRARQAVAAGVRLIIPTGVRLMPYLAFHPSYRFYWDDWGIRSHTPELQTFVPIGPTELRLTGRYYTQGAASFWNAVYGQPSYPNGMGKLCSGCLSGASKGVDFYTSDPKLSNFDALFLEVALSVKLMGLRRATWLPLAPWLADGMVELSYGHYFNDNYAHTAFGDAEVAGLTFSFPL